MTVSRLAEVLDSLAQVLDSAEEVDLLEGQSADVDAVRALVYGVLGRYAGLEPSVEVPEPHDLLLALSVG